jgi:phospholipid-transporting ATPase
MGGAWQREADAGVIREFLKLLAVCHTVIPEGTPTPAAIKYQARNSFATYFSHTCKQADRRCPHYSEHT